MDSLTRLLVADWLINGDKRGMGCGCLGVIVLLFVLIGGHALIEHLGIEEGLQIVITYLFQLYVFPSFWDVIIMGTFLNNVVIFIASIIALYYVGYKFLVDEVERVRLDGTVVKEKDVFPKTLPKQIVFWGFIIPNIMLLIGRTIFTFFAFVF